VFIVPLSYAIFALPPGSPLQGLCLYCFISLIRILHYAQDFFQQHTNS